ncbi:MAG: winged helix-turn-helix domain-containing protein, partial [Marinicella sp.]
MIYTLNNIQFEVKNQHVLVAGKVIPMSTRGHQCLQLFLASENQVLSKDFILKTLWSNVIVSDDSLFKVIQEIRKALRTSGLNEEVITNVYGKGYQLQPPVTSVSKKPIKRYLLWLLPLLLATTIIIIMFRQPQMQISDEVFKQKVLQLESNLTTQPLDLNGFNLGPQPHPSDQLKLAYLKGLERYKSGDYDRSIEILLAGIKSSGNEPSNAVLADANLLLSRMYIYRSDKESLQYFLDQAEHHYSEIGDQAGLISTAISRARYHQAIYQFPESIVLLEQILVQAMSDNDTYNQMRAISNLAYSFEQTNQANKHVQALEQTLNLALQIHDGDYAAYAYGALSQHYLEQADFVKAMKFAQQALKFVLEQQDTNIFQQGYSAFYNLLHELGHNELAQSHLQSAIDIQAHFNNESLLILAEINLAKAHMTAGDFISSSELLKTLLTTELTNNERLEVSALLALNSYFRQDNITAYTEAKRVYESSDVDTQTLLVAGTALALASHQLERNDESTKVFYSLKPMANKDWLFAYNQFLQLA